MNQARPCPTDALPGDDERPVKRSRLDNGTAAPTSSSSNVEGAQSRREGNLSLSTSSTGASNGNSNNSNHSHECISYSGGAGKLDDQPTTDITNRLEPRTDNDVCQEAEPSSHTAAAVSSVQVLASEKEETSGSGIEKKQQQQKCYQSTHLYVYHRQEYDEGMYVFNRALVLDNRCTNESLRSASLLYNVGLTHVCQGKYAEAGRWFELALVRITLAGVSRSHEAAMITMIIHHNLGHCHYRLGKNDDAMKSYRKALALTRDCKLGDLYVAASLNCIGVLLFHNDLHNNDSKKVMNLFDQCLAVYRQHKGEQSAEVATVLNNIGRVHYLESRHEEALQVYSQALKIRRSLPEASTSIDVAATVCNKGQTHHQRGELEEAMECYQEFLDIAPIRLGNHHRDIAIIYKCMAEIHHEKRDLEKARCMYEKALRAEREALGNFHPELASTLNKLGNLYYEMQDLDTSLQYYSEGLKVEQVVLEECHPHIVVTLMNIAQIHRHQGNFAAALIKYSEVHALQLKSSSPNDLAVANTISNMGLMQYQLKSYSSAFDLYQEALRIQRDHYGSDENLEVASTLNSIGLVLFNQGVYELAKGCFQDSLCIRRQILGPNHRDVAILLYNVATVHLEMGDDDLAIQLYKETLRVERAALGGKHHDVILTLQHLGLVHQQRGELEQALQYFSEALEIERQNRSGRNPIAVCKLLNLIGNIHLQQAHLPEMMECYAEASRICRDHAQQHNDTLVIAGYNFYGLSKLHPPAAPQA